MDEAKCIMVGVALGWFSFYGLAIGFDVNKSQMLKDCAKENNVYSCKLYALPVLEVE